LITSDGTVAYPVWAGIVYMLSVWAIVLKPDQIDPTCMTLALATAKVDVQEFYDQVGWVEVADALFTDAARFEDLRPIAQDYVHHSNLKVVRQVQSGGEFLLDIASGPLQHPDYLLYSENYTYRICGDLSVVALQGARRKLGDRGIYLLCDITNLPLKNETVDGFVSLHTIYHVPADEQATAFTELHRVLKPGQTGVVVYSWGRHSLLMLVTLLPVKVGNSLLRLWKKVWQRLRPQPSYSQEPVLYFHPHSLSLIHI
jgi:SAM-dependent methyltransferase